MRVHAAYKAPGLTAGCVGMTRETLQALLHLISAVTNLFALAVLVDRTGLNRMFEFILLKIDDLGHASCSYYTCAALAVFTK